MNEWLIPAVYVIGLCMTLLINDLLFKRLRDHEQDCFQQLGLGYNRRHWNYKEASNFHSLVFFNKHGKLIQQKKTKWILISARIINYLLGLLFFTVPPF